MLRKKISLLNPQIHIRQRKYRNMISTRWLQHGVAEHQESMRMVSVVQELQREQFEHIMHNYWEMQKERVDMQRDHWKEEVKESKVFKSAMERSVPVMESLTCTLARSGASPAAMKPIQPIQCPQLSKNTSFNTPVAGRLK